MFRSPKVLGAAFAAVAFLALCLLLAFGLTAAGRERSKVDDVLSALARGDARTALADLPVCREEPACVDQVNRLAERLRAPGEVEILRYDASVQLALAERTGAARVAWRAGKALPTVQCVRVRRSGPLQGAKVELLSISEPIDREGSCRR